MLIESLIVGRLTTSLIVVCMVAMVNFNENKAVSAAPYFPWNPRMGQKARINNNNNNNERLGELVSQLELDLKDLRTSESPYAAGRRPPPVDGAGGGSRPPPTAATRGGHESEALARLAEDIIAEVLDQRGARTHSARPGLGSQQRRFVDFRHSPTVATTTMATTRANNHHSKLPNNHHHQQVAAAAAAASLGQQAPTTPLDCGLKSGMAVGTSGYRLPCRDVRLMVDGERRYIKPPPPPAQPAWMAGPSEPADQSTGGDGDGDGGPNRINSKFERMIDQLISSARPSTAPATTTIREQARPTRSIIGIPLIDF